MLKCREELQRIGLTVPKGSRWNEEGSPQQCSQWRSPAAIQAQLCPVTASASLCSPGLKLLSQSSFNTTTCTGLCLMFSVITGVPLQVNLSEQLAECDTTVLLPSFIS